MSLGKPTPNANGDIQVDELSFFTALAAGNYVATVSAIGQRRQHAERRRSRSPGSATVRGMRYAESGE